MCCHAGLEDALIFVEIANSTSEMSPAFNLFLSGQYGTLTLVRPRLLNRDQAFPRLPWHCAARNGIGLCHMVTWEWGSRTSTLITFNKICVSGRDEESWLWIRFSTGGLFIVGFITHNENIIKGLQTYMLYFKTVWFTILGVWHGFSSCKIHMKSSSNILTSL